MLICGSSPQSTNIQDLLSTPKPILYLWFEPTKHQYSRAPLYPPNPSFICGSNPQSTNIQDLLCTPQTHPLSVVQTHKVPIFKISSVTPKPILYLWFEPTKHQYSRSPLYPPNPSFICGSNPQSTNIQDLLCTPQTHPLFAVQTHKAPT